MPSTAKLSTAVTAVSIVVVVPFTVRLPLSVRSAPVAPADNTPVLPAVVAVSALPVTAPVTLPVTAPVRGPLKPVAVTIPVEPVTLKPLSKVVDP